MNFKRTTLKDTKLPLITDAFKGTWAQVRFNIQARCELVALKSAFALFFWDAVEDIIIYWVFN